MALIPRRFRPTSDVDDDFLDEAADMGNQRMADYTLYDDYYRGEHKTKLTDRARKFLEASGLTFAENFCEPVIDTLVERLEITGFNAQVGNDPAPDQLAEWIGQTWQRNRADALQGVVHTTATVKGDAFLILDWDDERGLPRWVFNRPEIVKPAYRADSTDTLDYVSKVWAGKIPGPQNPKLEDVQRLNLYYPDRVEKYFRLHSRDGRGGWERWQDEGEPGWPLPWVGSDGAPLGIPVVHFRNKPLGRIYGMSELRNVIPQQDQLNKQILDLHDILDHQSWPQRWLTGVTKDNVSLKHKPGQWAHASPENAKFGQLEAADPAGVLAAIEQTLSRIARRSRTPLHLLVGGDMPSGEALRSAESGLVAKAERRQVDLGNSWEDAVMLGLRLAVARGIIPAVDFGQLVVESQWRDPESRSEADDAAWVEAAKLAGVSERTMMAKLGVDPDEEFQFREQERSTMDEAAARLLDAGMAA